MMTGDVGVGACSHYPWLRSLMGGRQLAGSCIFPRLAYWPLHTASRTRDKTRAHMRSFVYHTDPAVSPLTLACNKCSYLLLCSCLLCLLACYCPCYCANDGFGLHSPSPLLTLPLQPPLCRLFTAHIAKSVCGRAPVQWLARGALWPVTSSLVPRYVKRQNFPMALQSLSALVTLFPKYKKAAVAGSGWLTPDLHVPPDSSA